MARTPSSSLVKTYKVKVFCFKLRSPDLRSQYPSCEMVTCAPVNNYAPMSVPWVSCAARLLSVNSLEFFKTENIKLKIDFLCSSV